MDQTFLPPGTGLDLYFYAVGLNMIYTFYTSMYEGRSKITLTFDVAST